MTVHAKRTTRRVLGALAAAVLVVGMTPGTASADPDPRIGLGPGWLDAQTAISNLEHLSHVDKPPGFVNPANPGDFGFVTSDLAFHGNYAFMGNFNGFNIFDISNPAAPTVVTSVVCPGGQGDVSVYGDLLFMSVEESRGRVDCGTNPPSARASRAYGSSTSATWPTRCRWRPCRPAAARTRTRS